MDTILLFIGKHYILQKENTIVLKTKKKALRRYVVQYCLSEFPQEQLTKGSFNKHLETERKQL